ncbi:cyclic nucleotide-binding domain-containing protein [Ophiocordyceps sinensis CO18]|uniref:Cyclic nucleotide-binding domain-containing protein n=1 Tax=Ophiocordyceps sinensis (strain Co18 / CGMCC 3.14243) TaxID=911162 RepID=T5A9Z0_OPHSC|nr:cyclic nucleotide-binding domain-containing protein [Ophiocordyceps sinensis CO18]
MRRGRPSSSASPYRALAHHVHHQAGSDSSSLIRSFDVDTNPARPVRPSPLAASTIRDMPLDLVERVRSFPLFQSAPGEFLIAIGNHLKPQVHGPNDHIVAEGDDAKAMYWLVRGVVAVTSRDGEAVYAELKPGAFFGEIGVLMDMPRTATIVARTKCLLLVLKKEDLQLVMPGFPEMEQAIMEEAQERLNLLKKNKRHHSGSLVGASQARTGDGAAVSRATAPGEVSTGESGAIKDGAVVKNPKKRKSPSPGIIEAPAAGSSVIGSGLVNIRKTLKELPLFSSLPPDILHFLGLSVQPKTWPPFSDIIQQGGSGNEIYFIVQGEAEVVHHDPPGERQGNQQKLLGGSIHMRPRLRPGQYFGEVASLGLSADRTATVRSITTVECLMVPGEVLEELWRRCPPGIKSQVEETARTRYSGGGQGEGAGDIDMADVERSDKVSGLLETPVTPPTAPSGRLSMSKFIFADPSTQQIGPGSKDDLDMMEPKDPDPFLSVNMENLRNRRRQSLALPMAPPTPQSEPMTPGRSNGIGRSPLTDATTTPIKLDLAAQSPPDSGHVVRAKRAKTLITQRPTLSVSGKPVVAAAALDDDLVVHIFKHLDVGDLVRLRVVSKRWRQILTTCPDICHEVDLSRYNRTVNDEVIVGVLAPFIGTRAITVDLNNCFHITDKGFSALWRGCGKNVKEWRMRSVWDVSASQILEMSENAKKLEEIDWSNCRKVGDNLLGRVVGWVVPSASPPGAMVTKRGNVVMIPPSNPLGQSRDKKRTRKMGQSKQAQHGNDGDDKEASKKNHHNAAAAVGPGVVIGCPKLSKLNLSYCKHVTDRSMAHLAAHASSRLQSLSLTRCTSITDAGFQSWTAFKFAKLTHLCLADCTYLSDNAIVALVSSAKNLTHLDLSFCCALSDTSTEVVALGLPRLRELRMAFCGSAVSDGSLESIALHLNELEGLSVRGCVRVTGRGLESVLEGCLRLDWVDVSQCRNLEGWLCTGSLVKWGYDDRGAKQLPGMVPASLSPRAPPPVMSDEDVRGDSSLTRPKSMRLAAILTTHGLLSRARCSGFMGRRTRQPVRFIVEKGGKGLR